MNELPLNHEVTQEQAEETEKRGELIERTSADYQAALALLKQAQKYRARNMDKIADEMEDRVNQLMERGGRTAKDIEAEWVEQAEGVGKFSIGFINEIIARIKEAQVDGRQGEMSIDHFVRQILLKHEFSGGAKKSYSEEHRQIQQCIEEAQAILEIKPTNISSIQSTRDHRKIQRTPFSTAFDGVVVWQDEVTEPQLQKAGVLYPIALEFLDDKGRDDFSAKLKVVEEKSEH